MCHAMKRSTRHYCKFFRDTNGITCSETRNFSDLTTLFGVSVRDEVKLYMCDCVLLRQMAVHSTAQSYTILRTKWFKYDRD